MSQAAEPDDDELWRHLLGELEGQRAAELERWSQSSPERAQRLTALRAVLAALERPEPTVDLVASVDARIAAHQVTARRRRFAFVALATAACLSLLVISLGPAAEELRTKGTTQTPETWAGVRMYRLQPHGTPAPLGRELSANDSLLFAYTNSGPTPFTHLLIFGVSATGQVHWYYPAWVNPSDDPEAIAIRPSDAPIELHEQIAQPLSPGPFVLHAVFSRRSLRVSEIERIIAGMDAGAVERLPLPGTAQHRYLLEVH